MSKLYARKNTLSRYARGWSLPPDSDLDNDPNRASADPEGNRAQRRKAKKLGIKPATS